MYNRKIYAGTLGGGISIYSPKENEWSAWGLKEGLRSRDISVLTSEKNYLWVGTLGGGVQLYREPTKEEESFFLGS